MISAFGVEHTIEKSYAPTRRAAQAVQVLHASKGGNHKLGYLKRTKNKAVLSGHKLAAGLTNPKSPLVTPNSPYRYS